MARRQKPDYIPMRIEQLLEDRDKAKQDYDKLWYTRVIQELDWAQQAIANTKQRNCYMERDNALSCLLYTSPSPRD